MRDHVVSRAAAGALGGAVGAVFMVQGLRLRPRLPELIRPPEVYQDPGDYLVSKIEDARERSLPRALSAAISHGVHYVTGAGAGAALGVLSGRRAGRRPSGLLLAAAAMGIGMWAVGNAGLLPRLGLVAPLRKQGANHVAVGLLGHVGFGVIMSIPLLLLERRSRA